MGENTHSEGLGPNGHANADFTQPQKSPGFCRGVSNPWYFLRSQPPFFVERSAPGVFRARDRRSANTCSATETAFSSG